MWGLLASRSGTFFQVLWQSFCISDSSLRSPLHLSLSLPWSHAPCVKLHYSISIPIPFPKPELCDHPPDRYFMKQKRWVEIFIHEKYLSRAFSPQRLNFPLMSLFLPLQSKSTLKKEMNRKGCPLLLSFEQKRSDSNVQSWSTCFDFTRH